MGLNNNLGKLTEVLTVSGSGRVGLNTTSPISRFHINCGVSDDYGLYINGENRNSISGNLGIGTTTPSQRLDVNGNAIINGSLNVTQGITGSLFGTASFVNLSGLGGFVQGGNSFGAQALIGTNDNQSLALETSGSVRMFVSSSGNVGIGLTNPISTLQSAGTITVGTSTNPGSVGVMQLATGGASPISNRILYGTDGTGWRFAIGKNQGGTVTDQLIINTNGNVLVGTTADEGYKLYTDGTIGTSTAFGSSRRVTITALNTDFQLFPSAFSGLVVIRDNTNGGSGAWIQDPNMGSIQIANNMPGTWSITYNFGNGTTNIRKTSGTVPVLIGYALYGNG
jgi:hypothetical protein